MNDDTTKRSPEEERDRKRVFRELRGTLLYFLALSALLIAAYYFKDALI